MPESAVSSPWLEAIPSWGASVSHLLQKLSLKTLSACAFAHALRALLNNLDQLKQNTHEQEQDIRVLTESMVVLESSCRRLKQSLRWTWRWYWYCTSTNVVPLKTRCCFHHDWSACQKEGVPPSRQKPHCRPGLSCGFQAAPC